MATKRIKDLTTGIPAIGDFLAVDPVNGSTYKVPIGPGTNRIPFHTSDGRGVELKGAQSVAHLAGEFAVTAGGGRWVRLFQITLDGNYQGARGEIWFGRTHDIPNLSSRLAYYVCTMALPANEARLALAPGFPTVGESSTGVITDVAIVQTGINTYELWVQTYTDVHLDHIVWHHQGAVHNSSKISYAPLQATALPRPTSGGLSVQWSALSSSNPSLGWFGRIVQFGSNSNGSYIRYDNGTQICWHYVQDPDGGIHTWTYPAAFSSIPVVVATPGVIVGNWDWNGKMVLAVPGSTFADLVPYSQTNTATPFTGPITYGLIAIGRWK